MARRKKGRQVDEVKDRTGAVVKIMFDPNKENLDFFAEFSGEMYRDPDAKNVKRWAINILKQYCDIEWKPLIQIWYKGSGQDIGGSFFGMGWGKIHGIVLRFTRFYAFRRHDGVWRRIKWQQFNPEDNVGNLNRLEGSYFWSEESAGELIPPIIVDRRPGNADSYVTYLNYTPEVWAGLKRLVGLIDQLNEDLKRLVHSDEGVNQLETVGAGIVGLLTTGLIQGQHTDGCVERTNDAKIRQLDWGRTWPGYCRNCEATGGFMVRLYPEVPYDIKHCMLCVAKGRCPRCGEDEAFKSDDDVICHHCQWTGLGLEDNRPTLPDCDCFDFVEPD